jgi:hypothetical protein
MRYDVHGALRLGLEQPMEPFAEIHTRHADRRYACRSKTYYREDGGFLL